MVGIKKKKLLNENLVLLVWGGTWRICMQETGFISVYVTGNMQNSSRPANHRFFAMSYHVRPGHVRSAWLRVPFLRSAARN